MKRLLIIGLLCLISCVSDSSSNSEEHVKKDLSWQPFTQDVFHSAEEQNKLVLLDIGANWCHWCHVMDEKTYDDKEVQQFLNDNFILAREDQDSRPDLYAAYRNWGWPAIIVFNSEKEEVLKLKGYQERDEFLDILRETIDNPIAINIKTPQPSELKVPDQQIFDMFLKRIDHEKGMYVQKHKSISLPGIIHGVSYYRKNDSLKKWLDLTIKNSYALVDPVWSGAYQYSTHESWNHQHYEKLLRIQATYIEAYARYGMVSNNNESVMIAQNIYDYCKRFLGTESSLFYNSQNADVISGEHSADYYAMNEEGRMEIGVPSVDENIYLKENALLAKSMIYLWAASDEDKYLNIAIEMTERILYEDFMDFKGLYHRSVQGSLPLSFEDNRVLLELVMIMYQATGNKNYLSKAESIGASMIREFDGENGMFASSGNAAIKPVVVPLNNLEAALNYAYLSHLTGKELFLDHSKKLITQLDQNGLAKKTAFLPLLLRSKTELNGEPYHAVLISDGTNEKQAQTFFKMILGQPNQNVIFERAIIGQFTEDQEILYNGVPAGTLFMCTSSYCSAPITSPIGLQEFLKTL